MAAPTPIQVTLYETAEEISRKITIPVGGDADVTATNILDLSSFTSQVTATTLHLKSFKWSLEGFAVNIFEDATTDVHLITLASGTGSVDFTENTSIGIPLTGASGSTGDLMMTTSGLGATTETGYFIITVRKN